MHKQNGRSGRAGCVLYNIVKTRKFFGETERQAVAQAALSEICSTICSVAENACKLYIANFYWPTWPLGDVEESEWMEPEEHLMAFNFLYLLPEHPTPLWPFIRKRTNTLNATIDAIILIDHSLVCAHNIVLMADLVKMERALDTRNRHRGCGRSLQYRRPGTCHLYSRTRSRNCPFHHQH